jgi:tyrosine-protein kinase Etk/Wzc
MTAPKIPKLNEEFDLKLFRHILSRKLPLIFLIFFFALLGAYLMLRYTQPIYQSRTIIQIETESKAEKLLDIGRFSSEQFSQKIELLRSRVFLERVFAKLPLLVNYYNEGKFLNHELYTSSPFMVNYVVYDPVVYGIPFRLSHKVILCSD